ncbi:MAG: ATP synthase F1 subunit gamma [Nitrospirae bacterium]|nr:MAG: ATP synthase F1 subunit gamma [Nitrospirota bacterium]
MGSGALREIKRRINSVKSTAKITRAMKMISSVKLRRYQDAMMAMRPYSDKIQDVLRSLARPSEDVHPLLKVRPRQTVEVLVITSDRGLCGAFNTNVLREAHNFINSLKKEGFEVSVSTVGRKARDYFRRRGIEPRKAWTGLSGKVTYSSAKDIAVDLIDNFIGETFDELFVVYNEFKTVALQKPTRMKLLPLAEIETEDAQDMSDFLIEPSEEELFNRLLPKSVEVLVYRALLESQAAEEAARMTAMENATNNAEEMIKKLTLEFNKVRQATITAELMDIVGGAEAIKE